MGTLDWKGAQMLWLLQQKQQQKQQQSLLAEPQCAPALLDLPSHQDDGQHEKSLWQVDEVAAPGSATESIKANRGGRVKNGG